MIDKVLFSARRSRRLSEAGGSADLSSAPDGGLITGATPRRTPRTRRHNTSVRAEDVETALSLTPLPTLVEETGDLTPTVKRGRGRPPKSAKTATPSLNVISEENVEPEPSQSTNESEVFLETDQSEPTKPSSSRGKRKQIDDDEEDAQPTPRAKRISRRATITTLEADVDLFTPTRTSSSSSRRASASSGTQETKKKYIAVKKKTSVRIK